ncbi:MAG TPA: hypothetical protein DDX98_05585 [Bacteroidales bacterium]|jgi:hypothetical protein|nr:hypothetical protein [Bacteroidales bacterium]
MEQFNHISDELRRLIVNWEQKLKGLSEEVITKNKNSQFRNIKQIVGHMVDSASNNTHRVIHLQYQKSPINFPDYANLGINDKWLAIQNYNQKDWQELVQLWKHANLHFCHVIENIDPSKLRNIWIAATRQEISLKAMIEDFPRHFKLHLNEIDELIKVD